MSTRPLLYYEQLNKPSGEKPVALIELPPDIKVVVARLTVDFFLPTDNMDLLYAEFGERMMLQYRQLLSGC